MPGLGRSSSYSSTSLFFLSASLLDSRVLLPVPVRQPLSSYLSASARPLSVIDWPVSLACQAPVHRFYGFEETARLAHLGSAIGPAKCGPSGVQRRLASRAEVHRGCLRWGQVRYEMVAVLSSFCRHVLTCAEMDGLRH